MSQLLHLASDFIERMANPANGILVNDDCGQTLGSLLGTDEFVDLFNKEVSQLDDPEAFSPHGWLWLINWARSKGIAMNTDLLLYLVLNWSSVFMLVSVIDQATRRVAWERVDTVLSLNQFSNPWLRKLLVGITREPSMLSDSVNESYIQSNVVQAENILVQPGEKASPCV